MNLLIALAAIALAAGILLIFDWFRRREEQRRRNLWRQRVPRRYRNRASGNHHDARYP